jgi:recombination protein RecT
MSEQNKVVALKPVRQLEQILNTRKDALKAWARGRIDPAALIRWAVLEYSRSEQLRACTPESIYFALIACAQLGLEPSGVRQEAFIVPFKRTAIFMPGYRGYIVLARRAAVRLVPHVVYDEDLFELDYISDKIVTHKPALRERGEIIGAYAWARLPADEYDVEWMDLEELEHVREVANQVRGGKDSPSYKEWPDQMYRKAPIRRISKRLPMGEEMARAVALDVAAEMGDLHTYHEVIDVPADGELGDAAQLEEPDATRGVAGAKARLRQGAKQTPASENPIPPDSSPASADPEPVMPMDLAVEVMALDDLLEHAFDAPDSMPHVRARIERLPEGAEKERLKVTWTRAMQEISGGPPRSTR